MRQRRIVVVVLPVGGIADPARAVAVAVAVAVARAAYQADMTEKEGLILEAGPACVYFSSHGQRTARGTCQ
jgi:hypothetical protein